MIDAERLFSDDDELDTYVRDLRVLQDDRTRRDIAWRFALDADLLDDRQRTRELSNWLELQLGARVTAAPTSPDYTNYGAGPV